MAAYLLRDIDDDLYEKMRIKAIREHVTLKEIFHKFILQWVTGKIKLT